MCVKSLFKQTTLPYLLVTACSMAVLLAPYIFGSLILPRTEELNYSLYPLILWSRHLFSLEVPLWYPDAALGIPWPIPHTMSHTPLAAFFLVLPVYNALASLLAVHIAIQAFFTIRICQYFEIKPVIIMVVLVSVLLAAPMEYLVLSDAAAVFMSWTLLPVVMYALLRLLKPAPFAITLGYILLLGGAVGYGNLNGHTGVFATHVLGMVLIVLLQPRTLLHRWHVYLFATLLAFGIGAEKIYIYINELPYFGKDLDRLQYTFGQNYYFIFWNLFLKPVVPTINVLNAGYWNTVLHYNLLSRCLTFGSPLCSILLLCGLVRFLRGHVSCEKSSLGRAMWLTFTTCFFFQFIPTKYLPIFISASWTFRDPGILIGLLLAGILCDKWFRQVVRPSVMYALLGIHVILLLISAVLFTFGPNWRSPPYGERSDLYNRLSVTGDSFPLQRMILEYLDGTEMTTSSKNLTKRVVYDGRAADIAHRGYEASKGLHLNILPLYGIQEVSFLTKGLSLDVIHPSQSKPYGMISTLRFAKYAYQSNAFDWVQQSPNLLDLLGIRLVVGIDNPIYELHGLHRIGIINPEETRPENVLALYQNPRAFPRAFFVAPEILGLVRSNPRGPANTDFLTSMDVSPITDVTDPWRDPVHIQDRTNGLALSFATSDQPRTLLITTMFRPEWRAFGGELSSFHGLMRLMVPANTTTVTLDYKPIRQITARFITLIFLLLTIVGILTAFVFAHRVERARCLKARLNCDI